MYFMVSYLNIISKQIVLKKNSSHSPVASNLHYEEELQVKIILPSLNAGPNLRAPSILCSEDPLMYFGGVALKLNGRMETMEQTGRHQTSWKTVGIYSLGFTSAVLTITSGFAKMISA